MAALGTYSQYPSLVDTLPSLVRQQRRLEAKLAAVAQVEKDEKALRAQIDQLLVAAGLQKSEVVTCAGYDIKHNERDGPSSLNPVKITEQLIAAGVAPELVAQVLMDSTDTGAPSSFATVRPSKGAQVRAPQEAPATVLRMAKADLSQTRRRA
jgi:hypothetical protein